MRVHRLVASAAALIGASSCIGCIGGETDGTPTAKQIALDEAFVKGQAIPSKIPPVKKGRKPRQPMQPGPSASTGISDD